MSVTSPRKLRLSVRRNRSLAAVVVALLALGACGGDDANSDGAAASEKATADAKVSMKLIAFAPAELDVDAGTTVTWSQDDAGFHTVTSGTVQQGGAGVTPEPDSSFDSGRVAQGDDFEFTFDEPGSYPYFCAIHPATMRGEVRVR